jgi:tetratricopeptide (TPR) repeat protein
MDELLAAEPDNPSYLRQRMAAANYEGEIYDNEMGTCPSKPREAAAALGRYLEIARQLTAADPNNASARLSLASAYYKLSLPLGKIDPRQSVRMAKEGLRLFDEELARNPQDRVLRGSRARAVRFLAYAYQRNRDPNSARAAVREAIRVEERIVTESPQDKRERIELTISRRFLESL